MPLLRLTRFRVPTPTTQLWRYVRLSSFLSLLERRAIWFSAVPELEDKYEGAITLRDARRRQQLARQTARTRGVPAAVEDRFLIDYLNWIRARVFVSCWYAGDDESAALWQGQARNTDFVAIQTTYADLGRSIRRSVLAAQVRYINYDRQRIPEGSILNSFFCKRMIFQHESEVRLLLFQDRLQQPPAGQYIPVNPNRIVRRVMLAPFTQGWVRETVQTVMSRYGLGCPVVASTVDGQPSWEAGFGS
jgi:hypothetical protein